MPWKSERKYPRVKVAVSAEMQHPMENFLRRVQTANLGEGGCYIEMVQTLQPMASVDVVLWLDSEKVRARAEVVCTHPHVGNGIRFVRMHDGDREKLKKFLEAAQKTHGLATPKKS